MSFFGSMDVAASGMTAQRLRLDVISQNLANVDTTRTAEGGPYKRKAVLFESVPTEKSFSNILGEYSTEKGVRVSKIVNDDKAFPIVFNPTHPDADENGYVQMPNVNMVEEMTNMISASRSYEANITAFNTMKSMAVKALDIGKN
ncbi:MAG: flagellar basal body rod protein FlgC [Cellulosilyticaceae bacterium]